MRTAPFTLGNRKLISGSRSVASEFAKPKERNSCNQKTETGRLWRVGVGLDVVVVVLGVMVVVGPVVLAVVGAGDYLRAGQVCDLVGLSLEIFKYRQAMLIEIE
jgi:hypothetical protein